MNAFGFYSGVNNYPGSSLDLSGCVNDANDIAARLEPFNNGKQTILFDSDATRQNLLDGVRQVFSYPKSEEDWVTLSWSGHGSWIPDLDGDESDGRDEVICPYDYKNPISDDEIFNLVMDRPVKCKVFAIFDSCHSGTIYRFFNDPAANDYSDLPRPRFMDPDRILGPSRGARQVGEQFARRLRAVKSPQIGPQCIVLSGCGDNEFSFDARYKGRPNGACTWNFLNVMKKMRSGSQFDTLYRNLRGALPSRAYPQTPKLNARAEESRWVIPWLTP